VAGPLSYAVVGRGVRSFLFIGAKMPTKTKLTSVEVAVIVAHLQPLINGLVVSLIELRKSEGSNKNTYVTNQMTYYKNSISALRWAMEVAKQRGK